MGSISRMAYVCDTSEPETLNPSDQDNSSGMLNKELSKGTMVWSGSRLNYFVHSWGTSSEELHFLSFQDKVEQVLAAFLIEVIRFF